MDNVRKIPLSSEATRETTVICVLIAGPDSLFVSNRSNSNITRHNGMRLDETRPVNPGDTLSLGSVQLTLLDIRKYAAS